MDKRTKVVVDTNVVLDVMMNRVPNAVESSDVLRICSSQLSGMITATQTKDIFFLMERWGKKTPAEAKELIRKLKDNLKVLDVNLKDVNSALECEMDDYEDALIAHCGNRHKADYIITRNENDFKQSPVPALTPTEFLNEFYSTVK